MEKVSALIYVDQLMTGVERDPEARRVGARNGHRWCHLWSEDVGELHRFAARIGLRRQWFQDRKGFPHYDLVPRRRTAALQLGAVEKDIREWLRERNAAQASETLSNQP